MCNYRPATEKNIGKDAYVRIEEAAEQMVDGSAAIDPISQLNNKVDKLTKKANNLNSKLNNLKHEYDNHDRYIKNLGPHGI